MNHKLLAAAALGAAMAAPGQDTTPTPAPPTPAGPVTPAPTRTPETPPLQKEMRRTPPSLDPVLTPSPTPGKTPFVTSTPAPAARDGR